MHPTNKYERQLIRKRKGIKRVNNVYGVRNQDDWNKFVKNVYCNVTEQDYNIKINIYGETGQLCSCEDCGNPRRKAWGNKKDCITIQERKAPNVEEFESLV